MRPSFLSTSTYTVFIILLCLLILLGAWSLFIVTGLVFLSVIILFRNKKNQIFDDQLTTSGCVYAPVSGKVVKCVKDESGQITIAIKTQFYDQYGIYLPFSSKVENLIFNTKEYTFRFGTDLNPRPDLGVLLELSDKKSRRVQLQFMRFFTGKVPELVVLPGDLGRRQVNVGYLPFGGLTLLTMSSESDLLVCVGDRVVAAETILARFLEEEV